MNDQNRELAASRVDLARSSFAHQRGRINGIRGALLRWLPRPLLRRLKYSFLLLADGVDLVLGRRMQFVPPRYLNYTGDGDYERTGDEFLRYFVEFAGLTPGQRVLEVGCGVGRMARALARCLLTGSYDGIDIVPRAVKWCRQHISSQYSNFRFHLADIRNGQYNPRGRFQPTEYTFPFKDCEFHFIFLTSVFTHMLKADMEHYLREITRMLRPEGKCFMTFFLLNEEAHRLLDAGLSSLDFRFPLGGCVTNDERVPENAVAYDETYVRNVCGNHGLIVETVKYGAWCGRIRYLSYQDIVVVRKSRAGVFVPPRKSESQTG